MEYLQDETTFKQTEEDPNKLISEKVERWLEKWQGDEGLSGEACEWMKAHNPKPATLYANIETHKTGWALQIYYVFTRNSDRIFGSVD